MPVPAVTEYGSMELGHAVNDPVIIPKLPDDKPIARHLLADV